MWAVAITGSRSGVPREKVEKWLSQYIGKEYLWVLGGAIGVDSFALDYLSSQKEKILIIVPQTIVNQPEEARRSINRAMLKEDIEVLEPGISKKYADACLERNRKMVEKADAIIAFPRGKEVLRSGTWATVRYAKRLNRTVIIY